MVPIVLVLLATSVAGLRTRLLPRWLCWGGMALGVAGALGTVGLALAWKPVAVLWFGGLYGWVFWTLTLGVIFGLRWIRVTRRG